MKILFVSLFLPQEKAYHAGGRFVFEILRQLSRRHEIHLATRVQSDEVGYLQQLRTLCAAVHPYVYPARERRGAVDTIRLAGNYLGFSRFADRLIREGDYDLVQVEWVETAILIRRGKTPMVLDAHDVITKPAERAMRQRAGLGRAVAALRWLLVRAVEKMIVRRFDTVVTLSDFDRQYLQTMLPEQSVRTISIPAGLDIGDRIVPRRENTLLFLASYRYRPVNVAGALWFATEVLPRIRREIPEAVFVIAGYGPPETLTELERRDPGIRVPGFVDDLETCYKEATVFVAPILTGGGIIVKILDAMAAGTPVVTTSIGNEGVCGDPGRDLLVADSPEEFSAAVLSLMGDRSLAERVGRNGRAFVAERFSPASLPEKVERTWQELVGTKNREKA